MTSNEVQEKIEQADTDQWRTCVQELADHLRNDVGPGFVVGLTIDEFKALWALYVKAQAYENAEAARMALLDENERLRDYARRVAEYLNRNPLRNVEPDPLPNGWWR
jgi:hypothetical protein